MTIAELASILDYCTGIEVWGLIDDEECEIYTSESPMNIPDPIGSRRIENAYPVTDGLSLFMRIVV